MRKGMSKSISIGEALNLISSGIYAINIKQYFLAYQSKLMFLKKKHNYYKIVISC